MERIAVAKWTSVVVAVERIQKGTVLADQGNLGGGGTGIDAQDSSCPRRWQDLPTCTLCLCVACTEMRHTLPGWQTEDP